MRKDYVRASAHVNPGTTTAADRVAQTRPHQTKVLLMTRLTSEGTIFGPNGMDLYRPLLQFPPAKKAAGCPIAFAKNAEKVDEHEWRPQKQHPRPGACRGFRR